MESPDDYLSERQRLATGRSYTNSAVLTLILYCILWLPGLIVNLVYYNQAKSDMALTGHEPEGFGCLKMLLIVFTVVPAIALLLVCVVFGVAGIGSSS